MLSHMPYACQRSEASDLATLSCSAFFHTHLAIWFVFFSFRAATFSTSHCLQLVFTVHTYGVSTIALTYISL